MLTRVPNGMERSNVATAPECTGWPSAIVPDRQYIVTAAVRVSPEVGVGGGGAGWAW